MNTRRPRYPQVEHIVNGIRVSMNPRLPGSSVQIRGVPQPNERAYYVWLEAVDELPAGYIASAGYRQNHVFHRSTDIRRADRYSKEGAVLAAADFNRYGYPARVHPPVLPMERLRILEHRSRDV